MRMIAVVITAGGANTSLLATARMTSMVAGLPRVARLHVAGKAGSERAQKC